MFCGRVCLCNRRSREKCIWRQQQQQQQASNNNNNISQKRVVERKRSESDPEAICARTIRIIDISSGQKWISLVGLILGANSFSVRKISKPFALLSAPTNQIHCHRKVSVIAASKLVYCSATVVAVGTSDWTEASDSQRSGTLANLWYLEENDGRGRHCWRNKTVCR